MVELERAVGAPGRPAGRRDPRLRVAAPGRALPGGGAPARIEAHAARARA
jgi:hypothetical protein